MLVAATQVVHHKPERLKDSTEPGQRAQGYLIHLAQHVKPQST